MMQWTCNNKMDIRLSCDNLFVQLLQVQIRSRKVLAQFELSDKNK